MESANPTCPICKEGTQVTEEHTSAKTVWYTCPICGRYEVPLMWSITRTERPPDPRLSGWVREQNELGRPLQLTEESLKQLEASIPHYRPSEKQLKLLKAIERKTAYPGDQVTLTIEEDIPLAYAGSTEELDFCLESLKNRRLIDVAPKANPDVMDHMFRRHTEVTITPDGWDHLDKHARDLEEKSQVFVAMSFSKEMQSSWMDAIKPAIEQSGYTPYRIDQEAHTDRIDVRIMAEIKNSKFVVADVTEQKRGVYFEAGYALGLGLTVIWCVKEKDMAQIHFDTRQYNHIVYKNESELKERLFDFISAIIGRRTPVEP